MPPPTPPPKTLLEATVMEAIRVATIKNSDTTNRQFIQMTCSPEEIKALDSKEKIDNKIIETLTAAALSSEASRGALLAVIHKALELAAERAKLDIYMLPEPMIATSFSYSDGNPKKDHSISINKQSISDIEKLFI